MKFFYSVALIAATAGALLAQDSDGGRVRNEQTRQKLENTIYAVLFDGIRLSSFQDSSARAVIHESVGARDELDASSRIFQERAAAIMASRDTQIRRLLSTTEQRAQFDLNVKKPVFFLDRAFIRASPQFVRH